RAAAGDGDIGRRLVEDAAPPRSCVDVGGDVLDQVDEVDAVAVDDEHRVAAQLELVAERAIGVPAGRMDAEGELPVVIGAGPLINVDVAGAILVRDRGGEAVPALGDRALEGLGGRGGDGRFAPRSAPLPLNELVRG